MKRTLHITHLYPDLMNIYGDLGNIITLVKRCEWRDIKVSVRNVSVKESFSSGTDIFFMGGGQDEDQITVFKDLLKKKEALSEEIMNDKCFLGICGAYQLMGKSFLTGDGRSIRGLGILDLETKAPGSGVKQRCIGNIVCKINEDAINTRRMDLSTIVGFENHSGQTFLGEKVKPLGIVLKGFGNNQTDKTEGVVYRNLIGTYMHGSFLPKNPHIADWLIAQALRRKYKGKVKLTDLDDFDEIEAHQYILDRYNI